MRMRDCCSSSWAAPTRLLFLSADCLALSSCREHTQLGSQGWRRTEGGLRTASLLLPQVLGHPEFPATIHLSSQEYPSAGRGRAAGGRAVREPGESRHLGRIGLLQLLLVLFHLVFMLGSQLLQSICQPALKFTLLPIINLHQPGLMAALGLTKLLEGLDQ